MTRASQRTPLLQADASQSGRPRSTNSTNWNCPRQVSAERVLFVRGIDGDGANVPWRRAGVRRPRDSGQRGQQRAGQDIDRSWVSLHKVGRAGWLLGMRDRVAFARHALSVALPATRSPCSCPFACPPLPSCVRGCRALRCPGPARSVPADHAAMRPAVIAASAGRYPARPAVSCRHRRQRGSGAPIHAAVEETVRSHLRRLVDRIPGNADQPRVHRQVDLNARAGQPDADAYLCQHRSSRAEEHAQPDKFLSHLNDPP